MATSDLRDLERRFHTVDAIRDDPEAAAEEGDGGGSITRPVHPEAYFTIDSRRLASRHKKSVRDRRLLHGVKQFNLDPEKGIR